MSINLVKRLFPCSFLLLVLSFACAVPATGPVEVSSPDGTARITWSITEEPDGSSYPVYQVSFGDRTVLDNSPVHIDLRGMKPLGPGLKITGVKRRRMDETYEVVAGKSSQARNRFNEAVIGFQELRDPSRNFSVEARAYNDGVAFRYVFPEQQALNRFEITDERTEFRFTADHECVALPLHSYTTSYETEYRPVRLSDIEPGSLIGLPLLVKVGEDLWAALAEADLTDYAGMYLSRLPNVSSGLVSDLSPLPDGGGVRVRATAPQTSPWRVVMLAAEVGRLIESDIITNLNDPCEIEDTSWIKAGKTAWPWWSGRMVTDVDFEGGMNTATMKHYIDFADEIDLEYLLVDAEWYGDHRDQNADITTWIDDINIPEVISYAAERSVKVHLWLNWGCVQRQMDVAFPLYRRWGIAGIKVDYMNRDDQDMVRYYHRVVKTAAENQLTVDFHGAYKPTGFRRTYPNLITREGVLGLEYVKWSDRAEPEHNVTIPFTRMLVGPIDYTPGGFLNVTREDFKSRRLAPMAPGTRAHQLAMFVVYESPFQMCVDYPGSYRDQPGIVFLKAVPATWDETRVLNASVGDYITIARRQGSDWFLGSMTDWTGRRFSVSLDFLGPGAYRAAVFADSPDADRFPTHLDTDWRRVTASDRLEISLAPGGGQAVWFKAE